MNILFLFLDGVGLGSNDPVNNPFATASMPNLHTILNGQRLISDSVSKGALISDRATLLPLDACLGVPNLPQSASGQASFLTGLNVPAMLGRHYGPKPNSEISSILSNDSLLNRLNHGGYQIGLLNAYPPSYFSAIESGRRIPGAVAMAFMQAGIPLKTVDDLIAGNALSADFTGQGWHDHLGILDIPVITPRQAGERLTIQARSYHLSLFEYWLSDYAGHRLDINRTTEILAIFDQVLGGLLESWNDNDGLILITSDHGNLEDLSTRRHTRNPVPVILIGDPYLREAFSANLHNLTDIAKAIEQHLS